MTTPRGRTATSLLALAAAVLLAVTAMPAVAGADSGAATAHGTTVVASFDAADGELPEGVGFDRLGTAYVSLGPPFFVGGGYGEIRSIDTDGNQRTLALLPEGPAPAGLAVDQHRTVYAAVPDPGGPDAGILRITSGGHVDRIPGTEAMLVPNGLATSRGGTLYATDSLLGQVWRLPRGGTSAEPWLAHELLAGCEPGQLGANGIAVRGPWMLVANSDRGIVVRIRVLPDGSAGEPEIVAGDPDCDVTDDLWSLDGIAFDRRGDVYATLVIQNRLVRIEADGTVETLLTADDGLWNPASLAFGTGPRTGGLYVTNYAVLPPVPPSTPGSSLLRVDTARRGG